MMNVEQAIREVAGIYQALTGVPIQRGPSELPPEEDPHRYVANRFQEMKGLLSAVHARSAMGMAPTWSPPADVIETDREVRIEVELAGVPKDEVTVSLTDDVLWVRGRRINGLPEPGTVRFTERKIGAFQKAFVLPPRAKRDGIDARFQEGVLVIHVPTEAPPRAAEVPIAVK